MSVPREVASFRVYGIPRPQPRPRAFAVRGADGKARARVFDAGTAEAWKSDIVTAARPFRPAAPIEGPVLVAIDFFMRRPKRLLRARDPDGPVPCPAKPDRDNLEKAVLDCLVSDGWFRDDAQVVGGEVRKFYHRKGGRPGARIVVSEVTVEIRHA